ncbi:MAG TPA: lasso peptide biosynthesis B2 protein [Acidimicrobiales bacterium]
MSARLARLPGPRDARRFLGQLRRGRTRSSALRAVVDGAVVTWTLRRHGVRPLLAAADGSGTRNDLDPDRAAEVSAAVDAAFGLIPVAPTCLRRSLTLLRELRRLGLVATLHVGVRTVDGRVEAHAWVQAGEQVVNDDAALIATYTELAAGELERLLPALA